MIFSDPVHRQFYYLLSEYYDNPVLQKLKNDDEYSIYICKIYSLLLNENRYLIAITHLDQHPIKKYISLKELEWVSFQARVLNSKEYENMEIIRHSYTIKRSVAYQFSVSKISNNKEMSVYRLSKNEYPIEITLLHTKNNEFEYPNHGSLVSCLETFQTIISFSA